MASTITNLISTINVAFPVAGQDNDSQGFRNNFNIIQQSLLATEGEIQNLQNTISTLGGTLYNTATHVVALEDITIGTTATITLNVDQTNDRLIMIGSTSTGAIISVTDVVTAVAARALTESVSDTSTGTFAVYNSKNIAVGATVSISGIIRTVVGVDHTTNYIKVTPFFSTPASDLTPGNILTFTNPHNNPVGDLRINGDIYATGNITAYAASPSDARLKENVTTITNAVSIVNSLRGVYYDWTDAYLASLNFSPLMPKSDTGVIAQEVQEVIPQLVTMKANGELGVRYEKFAGMFIEAIKELSAQVVSLQAQVNALTTSTNV
jgi:hypothetical protein